MSKKNPADTVQITFRAPAHVVNKLDLLCSMYGVKRSDFFVSAILTEFDKINGNEQLKNMVEQMRQLSESFKSFGLPTSD